MLHAFRNMPRGNPSSRSVSSRSTAPAPRERIGLRVAEKIPNWHVVDSRHNIVPLYNEIPNATSVLVMHPYSDPIAFEERLKGYNKARLAFQEAGTSVLFICTHPPLINFLTAIRQRLRPSFPVYLPYGSTIDELKARGLYDEPSTTILLPDQTVAEHSDTKGIDPKDEAQRTLEQLLEQKLFLSDAPKRKF